MAEISHLALAVLVALVVVAQAAQMRLELRVQPTSAVAVAVAVLLEAIQGLLAVRAAQASSSSLTPALPSRWLVAR